MIRQLMFFQLTESQITKSQNAITLKKSVLSNSKEVTQAKKNLMSKQHQTGNRISKSSKSMGVSTPR